MSPTTPDRPATAVFPDTPEHRRIRRWCVRLMRPGVASGSGILVGPDLVLTCRHVVEDLFGGGDPHDAGIAGGVEVRVGLDHPRDGAAVRRGLRLYHDGTGPPHRPTWRIPLGAAADALDVALLRLDAPVEHELADPVPGRHPAGDGIDWLDFREPQSPARLAEAAQGTRVALFMYHFPDPGTGSPGIVPVLSYGLMPETWVRRAPLVPHQLDSAVGSSGAMIFATVAGSAQPFPIALHRGAFRGSPDKGAIAIVDMLPLIESADPALHRQISMRPADYRHDRFLDSLSEPRVELARSLIDRDVQAATTVGGMTERNKRVQPVFEAAHDEMARFQERLLRFDLPLRRLGDPQNRTMRHWALAGLSSVPPVTAEVSAWATLPVNSEGWLEDGAGDAVGTILTSAQSARERGAKLLLTAKVEVRGIAGYRALEGLMQAFARALTGPEAAGDFLLLLWVCDSGALSDKQRGRARNGLRKFWENSAGMAVVGRPIELGNLGKEDLGPWSEDVEAAFAVPKPALRYAIDQAWHGLEAGRAGAGRHAFGQVLQALDPPLRHWVYQHFRRVLETAQARRPQHD